MSTVGELTSLLNKGDLEAFEREFDLIPEGSTREFLRGARADREHDTKAAITHYERALESHERIPDVLERAPIRLVYCYTKLGDSEYAIMIGEKHLLRLQKVEPFPLDSEIQLKSILANCYSARGEFVRAICLTAEKPPQSAGEPLIGQWGWSRSVILFLAGHLREALDCGLDTVSKIDRSMYPLLAANIDMNNDWIRSALGEPLTDVQIADARKRVDYFAGKGLTKNVSEGNLVIAYALAVRGEAQEAIDLVHKVNVTYALTGNGLVRAATVHAAAGDLANSESMYRAALEFFDETADFHLIASIWRHLAAIYEERGEADNALNALKIAMDVAGVRAADRSGPLCISF